jgi:hypothetical protein
MGRREKRMKQARGIWRGMTGMTTLVLVIVLVS